jgi:hypothetical protein
MARSSVHWLYSLLRTVGEMEKGSTITPRKPEIFCTPAFIREKKAFQEIRCGSRPIS